jgi:hypothetical protein
MLERESSNIDSWAKAATAGNAHKEKRSIILVHNDIL